MGNLCEKAVMIYGPGRLRWSWGGESYTASGVKVPQSVIADDDALIEGGQAIPPDREVLKDLSATLPVEAMPEGYSLNPLPQKKA